MSEDASLARDNYQAGEFSASELEVNSCSPGYSDGLSELRN